MEWTKNNHVTSVCVCVCKRECVCVCEWNFCVFLIRKYIKLIYWILRQLKIKKNLLRRSSRITHIKSRNKAQIEVWQGELETEVHSSLGVGYRTQQRPGQHPQWPSAGSPLPLSWPRTVTQVCRVHSVVSRLTLSVITGEAAVSSPPRVLWTWGTPCKLCCSLLACSACPRWPHLLCGPRRRRESRGRAGLHARSAGCVVICGKFLENMMKTVWEQWGPSLP